jgi:hypothetical protein
MTHTCFADWLYLVFKIVKQHYEKHRAQTRALGEAQRQAFTPHVQQQLNLHFPRDETHFDVSLFTDRQLELSGIDSSRIRLQAPGIYPVINGQVFAHGKWSDFSEPASQSQAPWKKASSTEAGPHEHVENLHDSQKQTHEASLQHSQEQHNSPSIPDPQAEAPCTLTQWAALVEDRCKRKEERTIINVHTDAAGRTFYTYACTCGRPIVTGLPCEHVRAHAGRKGKFLHEIADFRLLGTTWVLSYDGEGFGEVNSFSMHACDCFWLNACV